MPGKRKIGIMGGTFDPIHFGHLVISEVSRFEFDLEKIIFIPTGVPPHKATYMVTNPEHRYNMVQLAIEDNPNFEISPIEIERPGPSYTVDTLRQLVNNYPDTEFYLITGADAILEITTWKSFEQLAELCYFIAATRPGYQNENFLKQIKILPGKLPEKIFPIEVPGVAVSSTEIRKRIAQGKPIKYLLPQKIENYIFQNRLYHPNL